MHDLAALQLIGQQMQGPTCASARRFATGDGDQLRLAFAIEHRGAITAALAASQRRFQPFLDTAFTHLFDRLASDVELVDDLPIMQRRTVLSLIGLQQGVGCGKVRKDTLSARGPLFAPSKPCLRVHE